MDANKIALKSSPQIKRIRMMSQIIKALFLIYVFAAGLIAVLFHTTSHLWRIFGIPISAVSKIPTDVEFLYALGVGIFLSAVVTIYRLLNLYEQGTVFSLANVRLYKLLSYLTMGYGLLNACGLNIGLDFDTHLKLFLFNATSSPWIIGGLFVLMISLIMQEACKIQEEQELTV